ncbi:MULTISPECIES: cytochrome b [Prosthecochloris]|uniref:Cytochrome bc complex cytochrome b subunit n=1 Tax=Prosthecochloris vibrioformis TaxID=1098 RepID=A0A5C4S3G6_PROVB|nr:MULTISPECIES: cytochrome bc complex cytochrome b subunit [Prosthecochloris]ANT65610.1 Cytochrome bc complex cytochrome b subunit [Prosthecochloris sp. CIB 2401]TNJ38010.1 cytochrome bc complex cytochrome b subunit [Prosthecochloris vibrioformis]
MAEENNNQAMAGKPAPAKPKPAAPAKPAAKQAAPAKPKPAASSAKPGVYKPAEVRADANPFKESKMSGITQWVQERYSVLNPVIDYMKKKEVPQHRLSFWYYFGGLTLFFFMIQVVTGLLLLLYYRPTDAEAFARFVMIQTEVPYGWLIRQVHAWSANLMVLMAFIHMFSTFFMKSYRKPREMMWVSGFVLLLLTLGFGFTGYLLPWNELAFFATQIGTEVPLVMPGGDIIVQILRGGEEVGAETLTRMFAMHVVLLPGILMLVLTAHLMLVQVLGTSAPIGYKEAGLIKGYEKFFPTFLAKDAIGWFIGFALVIYLAIMFPWEIGVKADALAAAPQGIKPEWYFWAQFQLLKDFAFEGGELLAIILFTVGGIVWVLVPFIDKKASREERSPMFTIFGLVVLAFMLIETYRVYLEYGW